MLSQDLLRTVPLFIRVMRRLYSERLTGEITLHHLRVMKLVNEGLSQSQMAQTLHVTSAGVSKTVSWLEKHGLLGRTKAQDKRFQKLKLTQAGNRALKSVTGDVEALMEGALNKLSAKERMDLKRGLEILDKVLDHLKKE